MHINSLIQFNIKWIFIFIIIILAYTFINTCIISFFLNWHLKRRKTGNKLILLVSINKYFHIKFLSEVKTIAKWLMIWIGFKKCNFNNLVRDYSLCKYLIKKKKSYITLSKNMFFEDRTDYFSCYARENDIPALVLSYLHK